MASDLDLGWLDPQLGSLRRTERNLGTGLSRALATRWGVDVVLVRVVFVVLALCGGVGFVVYLWGTALTPGRHGTRPVDSYLPQFQTWGRLGQQVFVLGTAAIGSAIISPLTPLPWALGVAALLFALIFRRNRSRGTTLAAAPELLSDEALVQQWRNRMSRAAGADPLPATRQDAPNEPLPRPRAAAPRPPASWLGGLLVVAAGTAAFVGLVVMDWNVLIAFGASLVAAGAAGLGFACLARRRRLPSIIVGCLALALVPSGWLATQASIRLETSPNTITHNVVGTAAVIDLTQEDLSEVEEIRIRAVASNVTLILPGQAEDLETDLSFAVLNRVSDGGQQMSVPVRLEAAGSFVEVREE